MDGEIELKPVLATATPAALLTKTFTGSGVAQTNQATTNLQIAGSCWRSRESVHEANPLTTETVTDGESIALPGASEATLHSEEESRDDENRTSLRSKVTTDFCEPSLTHRTRLDSYTKYIRQKVIDEPVCQPTEEARSGEGPNEIGAIFQDSSCALEEHIIDAIECGDVSTVKQWLEEEETRVNDCKGGSASHGHFFVGNGTALHWAAYYGQLEIAKLLLKDGADPYEVARCGETVLHWACQSKVKSEKLVDQLLTVSANAGKEGIQRWVRQCEENKELVHRLFKTDDQHPKQNSLAELPDNKGWTPLHYACYDNNMKLVQQLIDAGADPNARNDKKFTPLHLLNGGCDKLLDLLDQNYLLPRINDPVLQEDIIEKIESGKVEGFQRWLKRKKGQVNRYRGGFALNDGLVLESGTALHWAAYYGQFTLVEALAENGAEFRVLNSKKESVLHWACKGQQENEELVKLLVKKIDVNFPDVDGYTALHYALIRGNCNVARELLQASADRTAQSLHGETPVGIAFRSGNTELIDLLDEDHLLPRDDDPELETFIVEAIKHDDEAAVQQWLETTLNDEDVNCKRGGKHDSSDFEISNGTALHWAAYYGRVEIAKLLIGKGADPKVMDRNSETVLHWACKSKKENDEMVELLLGKTGGGESRCQVDFIDHEVYSPLHYACRQGHQELVIQPKKANADPSSRIGGDETKVQVEAEATKVQVDSTNGEGYTALHYACWQGHQKVTKLLKEAKADPRARSIKSYTPLDFAVVGKKQKWELARMLDDCHFLPRARYPRLETCIIEGGYMGCVRKWLKCHYSNVDRCRDGEEGGTALHWAAYHGQLDIVKLLIENGANPRARAYDNGTVLHWACRSEEGNRKLVRLLLKKGCKLDDRDKNGYTPFLLAALQGCYRVVEELLQWDRFSIVVNYRVLAPEAVFKSKGNEGHTPLVKASLKGHHSVVNLLLKRGAIVEPQDLHAAIEEGNEHVVSDLLQSPQWPTLLRQSWEETTPFHELIKTMPDIAKQILDRCVVSNPETRDPKSKGYEVVLDYSFVEDHQNGDGRCTSDEHSEPKYYSEKKEKAHKMRFDEVKKQKDCPMKYEPFKKSNHPLKIMVQHGRLEMLTHPVISSLLQHKWFHFGLWLYLLDLLIYIIFLVFLTAFALVEIPPWSNTCLQVLRNPAIYVCDNETERVNSIGEYTAGSGHDYEMVVNDTTRERNLTCIICELSGTTLSSRFAVVIIIFASIHLLMEAFEFCYEPRSYICDWVKFFEVSMFVLSIIFVSVFWTPCMCPQKWQWQIGVIAVLLAWINLIGFCANFPSIGIYIIMFGRIVITFVRVVILSVFLLTTFAITFYMTSVTLFQQSPFHPAANSMLKIMSMTAGDFSFDSVFAMSRESEDAGEVMFVYSTVILWIIFLIIMPILFVNMLIGLAVGDANDVKEKSRLTKLALQVDVILKAEHLLHVLHIHKYFSTKPSPVILTPNKTEEFSFKRSAMKLVYYLSGGEQYDAVTFRGALKYYLDSESEDKNEVEQMVEYVKEHTMEAKQKHIEVIEKVEERIEKMVEDRMQALEQLIKEAIPSQQEADKGPPEKP